MARRTITLTELISQVREKGDYENSGVFTDAILEDWINEAIAEVYDLLISVREDYYTTSTTLATVADTDSITLPDDLYKLRGLKMAATGVPLQRSTIKEMGWEGTSYETTFYRSYLYRMEGWDLKLWPVPTVAESITCFYIPGAPKLTTGTDTWDGISGYERLVIEKVLLNCDLREEKPAGERERRIQKWEADIFASAHDREMAEPFLLPGEPGDRWLP